MQTILGKKIGQTQKFLVNGTRIPVTQIQVADNHVLAVKTMDRDGYIAVQLGFGTKNRPTKSQLGAAKKGANLNFAPNFLREERFSNDANVEDLPKQGDKISASSVLEPGDIVDITGVSKGKGFAGVVKRHGFHGGPKTHGQSDRHRAPGAISTGTTPGRVFKGKRMAGKMGNSKVTVKNLNVIDVTPTEVLIDGPVPGTIGANVIIKKVGKNKKFVGIMKEASETSPESPTETVEKTEIPAETPAPEKVEEKKEEAKPQEK